MKQVLGAGRAGVVVIAFVFMSVLTNASLSARSVTLGEAISIARDNSPDAESAAARLQKARAVARQADSAALPRVTLKSSYMQTNSPMNAFGAILNTGTFDNSINFNEPGQVDLLTTSLSIVQPIWTGGRISSARASAGAASEAAELARKSALRALDLEVVKGYYGVLQARWSVTALEAALSGYEESLRVARQREDAGQLLKTERLNIEVEKARTESMLLAAQQQAELAKASFTVLLGIEEESDIEPTDQEDTSAFTSSEADEQVLMSAAPLSWPELEAMKLRVRAAEELVKAEKAARMPTVGAFASVQDDRGYRRDGEGQSWGAGLSISMNVYDGSEVSAKVAAAKASLREAREGLRKMRLMLELRLRQARINYRVARSQLDVCSQQVEQAEESAELSRERFSAGSLLSTELIGVESRLASARVQLAISRARLSVALGDLRNALGKPVM